jgi:hypothetical protein
MSLHGVNTVDAPLQERGKSRKKQNRAFLVIENPLKMDIQLSRATYVNMGRRSSQLFRGVP